MEFVNCDYCGSYETETLFTLPDRILKEERLFKIVKCANCGLVYLNPRPTDKENRKYYGQESFYSYRELENFLKKREPPLKRTKSYLRFLIFGKNRFLINFLLFFLGHRFGEIPHGIKEGKILDIGCGDGLFLFPLKKKGWQTYGFEISRLVAERAKGSGIEVALGSELSEVLYPDNFFDVVRIWHVLEHLPHPFATLKEIHRILKPKGLLIIGVPNFNSPFARLFKKRWSGLQVPRHLFQFTAPSVTSYLKKFEFQVQDLSFYSVGTLAATLQNLFSKSQYIGSSSNLILRLITFPVDFVIDKLRAGDCISIYAVKG